MGLTPAGGLMMGTRGGDLDPGLLVYRMRKEELGAAAIDALVNQRSGLLGVSGWSLKAVRPWRTGGPPMGRQRGRVRCVMLPRTGHADDTGDRR